MKVRASSLNRVDSISEDLKALQGSQGPGSSAWGLRLPPEQCTDQLVPPTNSAESTGWESKQAHRGQPQSKRGHGGPTRRGQGREGNSQPC